MATNSPLIRPACAITGADAAIPAGQRPPFGWAAFAVAGRSPATLRFAADPPLPPGPARLRLGVAVDVRAPAWLRVTTPQGQPVGQVDIRYACALQMFDLPLDGATAALAQRQGICLQRGDAEAPVFLLGGAQVDAAFLPALLADAGWGPPAQAFLQRLDSLASLTQYGWMEGCVLDGLWELGLHRTLHAHLDLFFPGAHIRAEDFHSKPMDDQIKGSESTNMLATLARVRPEHPAIARGLAYFQAIRRDDGTIRDHATVAEHNYTVAYPLAVIGQMRRDPALMAEALRQLEFRRRRLREPEAFWLRHHDDQQRTYRNWSRGTAWYLLGLARTLGELCDQPLPTELLEDLASACALVQRWQRADGLWTAYLDDPTTGVETSGSAGIAAALALAHAHGWASPEARRAAERAREGLYARLTPDGMLTGMSQSNKAEGGEDLQRSAFRVIGQTGMGLMGILHAVLRRG